MKKIQENQKQTENENGEVCYACHRPVGRDDMGMTKKLINRGTTRYYCIPCLAQAFDITEEDVRRKMEYFKSIGCTLFA